MANRSNDPSPQAKRRLRIPAALAVALVGTSATVAMTFAGCNSNPPEPIDAKPLNNLRIDAGGGDSDIDAGPDAVVGAAIDARPDAFVYHDAKPDAPRPIAA